MPSSLGASFRRPFNYAVRALAVLLLFAPSILGQGPSHSNMAASVGGAARLERSQAKAILLVRRNGDEKVIDPLRSELRIRGWRILDIRTSESGPPEPSLGQLVSEQSAAAAVRVDREAGRIELYVNRPAGDVEEALPIEGNKLDGPTLAVRVTETLRAHGLDFGDRVAPKATAAFDPDAGEERRVATTPPDVHESGTRASAATQSGAFLRAAGSRWSPPPGRSLWFELGPAVVESAGGWRTNLAVLAGTRLAIVPDWSIALTGLVPVTSDTVVAAAGRASVRTSVLGLSVARTLFRRSFGSSAVGLGAALLATSMRGSAHPGYVDRDDFVLTQAPFGYLRATATLHQDWQCFAVLLGGLSIPEVGVAFDHQIQRSWGRPFASLSLGIETRVFSW